MLNFIGFSPLWSYLHIFNMNYKIKLNKAQQFFRWNTNFLGRKNRKKWNIKIRNNCLTTQKRVQSGFLFLGLSNYLQSHRRKKNIQHQCTLCKAALKKRLHLYPQYVVASFCKFCFVVNMILNICFYALSACYTQYMFVRI